MNKKLWQIVAERAMKEKTLYEKIKTFESEKQILQADILELKRLENVAENGLDLDKIQIAETVIYVSGNPYGQTSGDARTIAECAIIDIANDCIKLRAEYFGNKRYSGYYQRSDHEYGMGPKHGSIVDEIELTREFRKGLAGDAKLTDEQKDACIYYLKNYELIKSAVTKTK